MKSVEEMFNSIEELLVVVSIANHKDSSIKRQFIYCFTNSPDDVEYSYYENDVLLISTVEIEVIYPFIVDRLLK